MWFKQNWSLTVTCQQVFKVNGVSYPVADQSIFITPETDIHRVGTRLWGQPCEVHRRLGELMNMPALPLVGGEPERHTNHEFYSMYRHSACGNVSIFFSLAWKTIHIKANFRGFVSRTTGSSLNLRDEFGWVVFHGHQQASWIQDSIVMRPLQSLLPGVASIIRHVHIRCQHWDWVTHAA